MSKYRYAVFSRGGKGFVIDLWKLRLDKLRKKLLAWSEAVKPLWEARGVKKCMVTLTYDTDGVLGLQAEWSPKHISVFLDRLKKRKGLDVLAYAWVVEMQSRGVPHYHIILLYKGVVPYPDKSGLWSYGLSNIKFKLRSSFYLVKYTGKKHQKDFSRLPSGARAYACSITDKSIALEFRALQLPEVIRDRYRVEGVDCLRDLVLPADMRSRFVGNAVTEDYALFISSEFSSEP